MKENIIVTFMYAMELCLGMLNMRLREAKKIVKYGTFQINEHIYASLKQWLQIIDIKF